MDRKVMRNNRSEQYKAKKGVVIKNRQGKKGMKKRL